METKFNFKSQIATDKKQSERLLALGLKKETADCYWWQETDRYGDCNGKWHRQLLDSKEDKQHFEYLDRHFGVCLDGDTDEHCFIPAWSLHRLIEMTKLKVTPFLYGVEISHPQWERAFVKHANVWDNLCDCIEWLIKEGYFNKEYLV